MKQPNKITAVAIYVCDDCGIMDCAPGQCMECNKDMVLTDFTRAALTPHPTPAPAATVTGWRPVEFGEVIENGDEFDDGEKWYPIESMIGTKHFRSDGMNIRRRLSPPALTDAMQAVVEALEYIRRECNEDSPLAIHEPTTIGEWNTERIRRIKVTILGVKDQLRSAVAALAWGAVGEGEVTK